MKFDNDFITFLTSVSTQIAVDLCSQIIYLMLISLFSFVVFNVSVCVYFSLLPTSNCKLYIYIINW